MEVITDSLALTLALAADHDPAVKHLLTVRSEQLLNDTDHEYDISELVRFVIVQPSDPIAQLEAAAGYPVMTSPVFEWVIDHGGWYEAATVLSDDGFGVILFVPDCEGIDATVLALLRDLARPAAAQA